MLVKEKDQPVDRFPVARWMHKRPILAFYVLCFAISWGLWLPVIVSRSDIFEVLAMVGLFGGPGIACIIVARLSSRPSRAGRPAPFWLAFLGAWIACAVILVAYQRRLSPGIPLVAWVIFTALTLIPAYVIASALSGPPGVRSTLSSLVRPRGRWGWYLLAVLLPLGMRLISVWIA